MRLLVLAVLLLGACSATDTARLDPTGGTAPAALPFRSDEEAIEAFRRVAARMEPVAETLCRRENPRARATYCDFKLMAFADPRLPPNAFQSFDLRSADPNRRPTIAFTVTLLRLMKNEDEIAFILGHEAGHQIANHIVKSFTQSQLGASRFARIAARTPGATPAQIADASRLGARVGARAYSKDFELEADVIGAYLAEVSGYDAMLGAQSFARFQGGSNAPYSTHPPSAQRLETVEKVAADIQAQKSAGRTPRLPTL